LLSEKGNYYYSLIWWVNVVHHKFAIVGWMKKLLWLWWSSIVLGVLYLVFKRDITILVLVNLTHALKQALTHKLYKHTCTNITFGALEKKSDHAKQETYYEIFNLFPMPIIKIKSVLMRFFLLNKKNIMRYLIYFKICIFE
jgi:hypothetical protein